MQRLWTKLPDLRPLRRFRAFLTWPVLVLVLCYSYLGFHMIGSRMGLWQLRDYQSRIQAANQKLHRLQARRAQLERETARLRSSSLDLDALDEEARRLLNVSQAKDIVIWLDESR